MSHRWRLAVSVLVMAVILLLGSISGTVAVASLAARLREDHETAYVIVLQISCHHSVMKLPG